jgi:hypothetical protein
MNSKKIVFLALFTTGCGLQLDTTDPAARDYALDAVKLIGSDVNGRDPGTYTQGSYTIDSEHRLLLKFERLLEKAPYVRTTAGGEVTFKAWVVGNDSAVTVARSSIKVCPLTRNWMMYASWHRAHTMIGGTWSPGGEIDLEGCVEHSTPAGGEVSKQLHFNMTQWFLDYPVARSANYGFAMVSETPVKIFGDSSGSYSPRLGWKQ